MTDDVVRKLYGRPPVKLTPMVDPAGNERWFAHATCMFPAALEAAGELDTRCVVCGVEVAAEERESMSTHPVLTMLGVNMTEPGTVDEIAIEAIASTRAWQCQHCARWQCNRCVCAALTGGGLPIPSHVGCGGEFLPPR
jgi:hypothetical protein